MTSGEKREGAKKWVKRSFCLEQFRGGGARAQKEREKKGPRVKGGRDETPVGGRALPHKKNVEKSKTKN